jgi:putative hemolysin
MIGLALLVVLIILSALFAMAETALTTVSRPRIAHLVELKKPGARLLRRLREDPARMIATVLVGNNLVNISASVLATTMIEDYFAKLGMRGEGLVIGVAIGIMTLFILVFGEITPKTLAIRNAEPLALWLSPVMLFAEWLLYPIAWLLTAISRPFIFLFGGRRQEKIPFITEEEIKTLLIAGEKEGAIEKEEREMISSVFKFTDLTVKQVMTERDKMACIGAESNVGEVVEKIKESGHSRIPVYDHNLDNIVGVVYAKDLLGARANEKIGEYFRQALFSSGETKISDLLEQMQAEYKHLAIVVDEFGHTVGLATLEDMVEEIVGEIHDEYERRK